MKSITDINPMWHLYDYLKPWDAASLIAGYEPTTTAAYHGFLPCGETEHYQAQKQVEIIQKALFTAAANNQITLHHQSLQAGVWHHETLVMGEEGDYWVNEDVFSVDEIKEWLKSKGITKGFFFPENEHSHEPDYLKKHHPNYAPKLVAAIRAWEAIQDPELRKRKSVKQAAIDWLETNYRELGLVYNEGRNDHAIESIAKIVNWADKGGAPATPVSTEDA